MSNINQFNTQYKCTTASVLRYVFDWYAENTITNEQVERVLEPVIKMILEGKFDRPRPRRFSWLFKPTLSLAVIGVLIYVVWIIG